MNLLTLCLVLVLLVVPTALASPRLATKIVAGGYHTCALLEGGELKCFGRGGDGQVRSSESINQENLCSFVSTAGFRG